MVRKIDGREWLANMLDVVEHDTRQLEQLREPIFDDVLRAAARLRAEIVAVLAGTDTGEEAGPEPVVPEYARSTRDSDYWLSQAVGFVVESPEGRVGVVEELRFLSRTDRPDALVVRGGRLGGRRVVVDVADIVDLRPREKRIRVGRDYDPSGNPRPR